MHEVRHAPRSTAQRSMCVMHEVLPLWLGAVRRLPSHLTWSQSATAQAVPIQALPLFVFRVFRFDRVANGV